MTAVQDDRGYVLDELAIEWAVTGQLAGRLPKRELRAAIAVLTGRGLPVHVIARRLHVSERTVHRWQTVDR